LFFITIILVFIDLIFYLFDVSIFYTIFCDTGSESEDVVRVISNKDDQNEGY